MLLAPFGTPKNVNIVGLGQTSQKLQTPQSQSAAKKEESAVKKEDAPTPQQQQPQPSPLPLLSATSGSSVLSTTTPAAAAAAAAATTAAAAASAAAATAAAVNSMWPPAMLQPGRGMPPLSSSRVRALERLHDFLTESFPDELSIMLRRLGQHIIYIHCNGFVMYCTMFHVTGPLRITTPVQR
jgi:hypothetical protein